jgi:outer membrane protein OmpA-like peptidoglycan-associated protein
MKKGPPQEEQGEKAPLWMISFADMISLLMAFFVMLLTMATTRSGKLCETGTGVFERSPQGFRESIATFGVPGMLGEKKSLGFERSMHHFAVEGAQEETNGERLIDADEERTKRLFRQLQTRAAATPSSVKGAQALCDIAPITFGPGACELDAEAEQYLARFCADLKASGAMESMMVAVVGAAPDVTTFRDKWVIAAERARVVADQIRKEIAGTSITVVSWGTTDVSAWSRDLPPSDRQVHVLLSILRKGESSQP